MPILDSLVQLVLSKIERVKGRDSVELTKMNKEIEDIIAQNENVVSSVIGFAVGDDEYEEEEE